MNKLLAKVILKSIELHYASFDKSMRDNALNKLNKSHENYKQSSNYDEESDPEIMNLQVMLIETNTSFYCTKSLRICIKEACLMNEVPDLVEFLTIAFLQNQEPLLQWAEKELGVERATINNEIK